MGAAKSSPAQDTEYITNDLVNTIVDVEALLHTLEEATARVGLYCKEFTSSSMTTLTGVTHIHLGSYIMRKTSTKPWRGPQNGLEIKFE